MIKTKYKNRVTTMVTDAQLDIIHKKMIGLMNKDNKIYSKSEAIRRLLLSHEDQQDESVSDLTVDDSHIEDMIKFKFQENVLDSLDSSWNAIP